MKMLALSLGLDLVYGYDGSAFMDWNETEEWAKPYIAALVQSGIVYGSQNADGFYINANVPIVREEMIAMVVHALGVDPSGSLGYASDISAVSDWAADYVQYVLKHEMIKLDGENKVNPHVNAIRADTAMMLYKMIEYLGI